MPLFSTSQIFVLPTVHSTMLSTVWSYMLTSQQFKGNGNNTISPNTRSQWEKRGVHSNLALCRSALTVDERCEEHPESAQPAAFVRPHPHHPGARLQHDIVGHRAAKFGLQVFDGTASVVHGHKVSLALVWVLHLVVQKPQINLFWHGKRNKTLKREHPTICSPAQ